MDIAKKSEAGDLMAHPNFFLNDSRKMQKQKAKLSLVLMVSQPS